MTNDSKDLTQGSLWAAIARLALPMIIGIIAVLSVSLVDTYFVGKLGTQELAALSFTFPVTLAMASLASGLGAGAASVVSRSIGAKNTRDAKRLATDSLLLATLVVLFMSAVGYFTIKPLFTLLGAKADVLLMISRYMEIWYISMPFLVIPIVANAIIRATGDALWPSLIMIGAALVNVALTPLLIFGWGPIPAMNIEGAAYSTMIARIFTFVLALYVAYYREKLIVIALPPLQEFIASAKQVLKVGLPAGAGSVVNPIGIAVVTAILATYGSQVVAAFGVATRIESFACIPMLALSAAIGPIAGQNWGADKIDRVIKSIQHCYVICLIWSLILAIVFFYFANPISELLASNQSVATESAAYLSAVTLSLWGYGIVIVSSAAFNSLGRSISGLGFYLIRSAVFYVPLSLIASHMFESQSVYYGISIANALAGILVGSYTLWWLSKARQCDCEPNMLGAEIAG